MKRALVVLAACGAAHPTRTPPPPSVAPDAAPVAQADPPAPTLRLPTAIRPTHATLVLAIDPDQDTYSGHVTYTLDGTGDAIWLDADPSVTITTATLDGVAVRKLSTSAGDQVGYAVANVKTGSSLELAFTAKLRSDPDGFYVVRDGDKRYVFSEGEAIQERKAFPCFDEPSFKLPWSVSITAPAADRAYANAPETAATTDHGYTDHVFEDTPALPSYLVTIAVGPFEEANLGPLGKAKIPSHVILTAGHQVEPAMATWIPKIVDALEDYMGEALPFDKLDFVAAPDFPGGQEDPGIIMIDAGELQADPSHADPQWVSVFIPYLGHEISHLWFGDDVTLAWWDDIWLNEGFASWMQLWLSAKLDPAYDRKDARLDRVSEAMVADAKLATHALHRAVDSDAQIEGAFDTVSYSKGAVLLAGLDAQLGEDSLRDILRSYVAAHARGSVTSDDFVAAVAKVSPTAADSLRGYVEQPGVPVVSASLDCKANPPVLHLHQERLVGYGETAPAQTWTVHVCAKWSAHDSACTDLAGSDGDLALPTCPSWIDPYAAASYARVLPDADLLTHLASHLKAISDDDRVRLALDIAALARVGKATIAQVQSLVAPLVATGNPDDLADAVALVGVVDELVAPDERSAWRAWIGKHFGKAARAAPLVPPKHETPAAHAARRALLALVGATGRDPTLGARARKAIARWLAGKAPAPRDADVLLAVAASSGDGKLFDAILARARTATGDETETLLVGLGGFTDPALVAKADDVVGDPAFALPSSMEIFRTQLATSEGQHGAGTYVRAHWDDLLARMASYIRGYLVRDQRTCDPDDRAAFADFMTAHGKDIPDSDLVIADTLAKSDSCIARRKAMHDDVAAWLKR